MGFALFVLAFPLQERMTSFQRRFRLRSITWTERRAKILLEVLGMSFVVVRDDGLTIGI